MLGGKALWFALAPTLLIYGFMNWDLFAVAFATGALVAFARRRDGLAGRAARAWAPRRSSIRRCCAVPLIAHRLHDREPDAAIRIGWATVGNLAAREPAVRHRVSRRAGRRSSGSTRLEPPDWDSLWFIGCKHVNVTAICGPSHVSRVNLASLVAVRLAFVAGVDVETTSRAELRAVEPRVPDDRAVPAVQQGLLAAVRTVAAAVLRARRRRPADVRGRSRSADVAVFVTRFSFFGRSERRRRPAVRRVRDRDRRSAGDPDLVRDRVGAAGPTRRAARPRGRRPRCQRVVTTESARVTDDRTTTGRRVCETGSAPA